MPWCGRDTWPDHNLLPHAFMTAGTSPKVLYFGDMIYITNRAGAIDVASYNLTVADCNVAACKLRNSPIFPELCLPRSLYDHGADVQALNTPVRVVRQPCEMHTPNRMVNGVCPGD